MHPLDPIDHPNHHLLDAAEALDLQALKAALAAGADINAGDGWALRCAANHGRADIVLFLLENGANVHARENSALIWAASNGHTDAARLLLLHGADTTADEHAALYCAAIHGHGETVRLLLESGADAHGKNDAPLRMAAYYGQHHVVDILAQHIFRIDAWHKKKLEAIDAEALRLLKKISRTRIHSNVVLLTIDPIDAQKAGHIVILHAFRTFQKLRRNRPAAHRLPADMKRKGPKPL